MADPSIRGAWRAPSTRRAILRRVVVLGLAAAAPGALLAACGGQQTTATRPTTAQPTVGQPPTMTMTMPMPMSTASAPAVAASPVSGTTRVAIQNFAFVPAALSVAVGATVTWTNEDDIPHTVTAQDKQYTSPALDTNDTFSHTFSAPGVYAYYCEIHPVMTGQIVVQA
jgi:plastocyanin